MPRRIGGRQTNRNWIAGVKLGDPFLPLGEDPSGVAVASDSVTVTDSSVAVANRANRLLTQGGSLTNGTNFVTASVSPAADRLVLIHITSQGVATSDRGAPTSVGGGAFTLVDQQDIDTFSVISVWRYMSATPFSGTVTITHANNQDICTWAITEHLANTGGTNGSVAIGTVAKAAGVSTTPAPGAITFAGSGANTYAAFSVDDPDTATVATFTTDAQFTQLSTIAGIDSTYGVRQETEYAPGLQETTCTPTLSSSENWGAIAFEVLPVAAGGIDAVAVDTVTVFDSAIAVVTKVANASDTVTVSDSAVAITSRVAVATDTVTVSDSAVAVVTLPAVASDTVTVSDSAVAVVAAVVTTVATDTVTVSDSASATLVSVASASDTVTVSDSAIAVTVRVTAAVDSVTVSDSAVASIASGAVVADAVDSVTVSDSAVAIVVLTAVASDSVTVSDSAAALTTRVAVATDSVTVSDSAVAARGAQSVTVTAVDSVTVSDSAIASKVPYSPALPGGSVGWLDDGDFRKKRRTIREAIRQDLEEQLFPAFPKAAIQEEVTVLAPLAVRRYNELVAQLPATPHPVSVRVEQVVLEMREEAVKRLRQRQDEEYLLLLD